jgi:ribosomal protein S18 acetylase RimI-like enzyme
MVLNQLITLLPQSPYSPGADSVERFFLACCTVEKSENERNLIALAHAGDGRLCGFAQFRFYGSDSDLDFILVDAQHRGKGYARLLLNDSFEKLRSEGVSRVVLEVSTQNSAAHALYQSFGFSELAVRKKYYRNGEDAVIMEKRI